ncbi:hypothetical protein ACHAW5_001063 [Stephanodiscus triporus]|uniref:Uncharacterized protein n=1 Tax=Stephanodiscus triporus TaxID=2934178 RepID=A0ABD3QRI5_9STRA
MDRDGVDDKPSEMDEQFRRIFSQQLAEVLRSKDEEETKERECLRTPSGNNRSSGIDDEGKQWERLRMTYVELCHDYPIISGGDEDCRRLAKALIPRQNTSNILISGNDKLNANKLALSSRLVDGVLQATARAGEKVTESSSTPSGGVTTESESMFGPAKITTSEGYAEIAFAVFVEGPYRCLQQADNMQTASSFLGSFQPPDLSRNKIGVKERSRLADAAAAKIVSGIENNMASEGNQKETAKTNVQDDIRSLINEPFLPTTDQIFHHDDDSMKEVFAEESDPDDYMYESCSNPYDAMTDLREVFGEKSTLADDRHDLSFDPLKLSEPSGTNRIFEGARKSIYYLLSTLSYSKLAFGSLSSRAWSEGGMSESLADLSFILLLEISSRDHGDTAKPNSLLHPVHHDGQDVSEDDVATLWDRPLRILRDRALDKNHGHDALPSYLQLLTAFLSHSEPTSILSSPVVKAPSENSVPPVMTVGISSFAMICSSKEMISAASGRMCATSVWSVCPREEIKKAIMSSLYSLTRIVECVSPRKSIIAKGEAANHGRDESAQEKCGWIRIIICIIQIVEYLTNLQARFDFQPLFEGGGSRQTTMSKYDAQALSDSGLFREMLSMYTATRDEKDTGNIEKPTVKNVVRLQLLRTIFMLSTQSSEILGRYALRVPDFVKEVHSSTFQENNLVDGILWASIGSSLLENKSYAANMPRLKLRTSSKSNAKAPPIKTTSLAEQSIVGFETICKSTKMALDDLRRCVPSSEEHNLGDEQKKEYDACKTALGSIKLLSNCFSTCPVVAEMWLDSLRNKGYVYTQAVEHVAELKSTLANLPSFPEGEINFLHPGHKKDDDSKSGGGEDADDQKIHSMEQFRKDYRVTVASVRSYVKVIALALESQRVAGPFSTSKTD